MEMAEFLDVAIIRRELVGEWEACVISVNLRSALDKDARMVSKLALSI